MNTNTQPKVFEWTDELVAEYSLATQPLSIWEFKRSKQQPIEDRIVISHFNKHYTIQGNKDNSFFYQFCSTRYIPEEKHEAVKQAIEKTLNGEMDNPTPQPQDTKEDNPDPKEVANYLLQQGTITLTEMLLVISQDNWEDGRKKLKEILDAKKAPKEEQKPVLFTTEDGVDVDAERLVCILSPNSWRCHYPVKAALKSHFRKESKLMFFSTKESAEQYILENKPCLSFKEISEYMMLPSTLNEIKKLAKSKTNQ